MAGNKGDWDYALRIRGFSPRTIPLGRLGEYLKAYSALLGEGNEPRYAGLVKGSAILRAAIPPDRKTATHRRLLSARGSIAANDDVLIRARDNLAEMLVADQASGDVEDREGAVLLQFERRRVDPAQQEPIVQDTGVVDGVVVSLVGADDTVHLRILDSEGRSQKITVRDLGEARRLARHFRGDVLRVHVHGTWRRTVDGVWEPHALYLDRFEELDSALPGEVLSSLSDLDGNGWATMKDPHGLLRALRGDE